MPINQIGEINTTALYVPDVHVQIVPPRVTLLNGVPTNVGAYVGTASWGPVNAPVIGADMSDYVRMFGPIKARKYDMGTVVATAVIQGAKDFRWIRVTDGTDAKATVTLEDEDTLEQIIFDALYSGAEGNKIQVAIAAGTNSTESVPTYRVTVSMPGRISEVFDNIGGSGATLWINIKNAINLGQTSLRGPSQLIKATVPSSNASAEAPTLATSTLTGGTDGVDGVTASTLIGNSANRTGMYAIRGTGASIGVLCDNDTASTVTEQASFGKAEGVYMVCTLAQSQSVSQAVTTKAQQGIDSYSVKLLHGDWVYFNDTTNNQVRLVSPQGFVAGRLQNLAPNESSLNKPIYGVVGTERSANSLPYSTAELQELARYGFDVITNPVPGGNYFGCRLGKNTSSNAVIDGDNYTRMTNYIAATLNAGMGIFVGKLQSPAVRREAMSTVDAFFSAMEQQGLIGSADGSQPFSIQLDDNNNPQDRVALGYMQIDCKVRYLSVIEHLLVNVEGGQSVEIQRQDVRPA